MKETIAELWYGNIAPVEYCGANDKEINRLLMLMERNRNCLSSQLNEAQMTELEKYVDYSDKYAFRSALLSFIEGFSLGSKIMAEALAAE